jgi:hypothetical protein
MFEMFRLQMRTTQMLVEAQTVIGMRLLGMAGVMPAARGENMRMVTEKQDAFAKSGMAAMRSMMAGHSPVQTYTAALAPIGRTTQANSRRLTKVRGVRR